jgi:hypothetical protein
MIPRLDSTEAVALLLVLALLAARFFLRCKGASRVIQRLPAGVFPAIEVRDRDGGRELWFERKGQRMLQARIDAQNRLLSRLPYIDGLHLYTDGEVGPRSALFLGCGAGIGPRQFLRLHPAARIDVVDVDARVFDVAAECFEFQATDRCTLHVSDGREFLERRTPPAPYDRIIVDVFGANDMPAHLCTAEFFRICREQLGDHGVCVVNTAGTLEGQSSLLVRAIHAGLVAAFGFDSVRVHAVPRGRESRLSPRRRRNLLLFAFRSAAPAPSSAFAEQHRMLLPALTRIAMSTVAFPAHCEPLRDASVGRAALELR